ncbi:MAG: molybdopterin molybdotransferase MoeA [Candidatus Riflebacteria bacterium]|nr:molybdopterin molybdotransferase MoeA [Candidatus Riflebacteria bacterium]
MLDLDHARSKTEALLALFDRWAPRPPVEMVPIAEAIGRVPAQDLHSRNTLPVVRASMMDGIAVVSERFRGGLPDTSRWVEGKDFVRADTGDDFDDRFDAVIPIEEVTFLPSGGLRLDDEVAVAPGACVRPSGSLIQPGDPLLVAGLPIRPCDLAALAIGGITEVPVRRRPVVAFIPTGSELVPAGTTPQRGQNVDCNSLMARHLLLEMGAVPLSLPIVKDRIEDLESALDQALPQADIVVLNGGSSKGGEDVTATMLGRRGEVLVHGIAAGPGRPMCLSMIGDKPVINLPGPVVAAFHGLDWCIRAVVSRYLGLPMLRRPQVRAVLAEDMPCPKRICFLCRLQVTRAPDGTLIAHPLPFRSVRIGLWLNANGQFVSEVGQGDHRKGDVLDVELLCGEEFIRPEGEPASPALPGEASPPPREGNDGRRHP